MGELRRMFFNERRLGLLFLLCLLSAGHFYVSNLSALEPGAVALSEAVGDYTKERTALWCTWTEEERLEAASKEADRLWDYYYFASGVEKEYPYSTLEEAKESISDIPYLYERAEDLNAYGLAVWYFSERAGLLTEEAEYIAGYQAYLEKIQTQAEVQQKTGVFGNEKGFSKRNLRKTAAEFERLFDVNVEFGNGISLEKWLEYTWGDYYFLLVLIIFVLSFFEERKNGLWSLLRTTKHGRRDLGLERLLGLLLLSSLCTLLFNGVSLLLSLSLNGGNIGLQRAVQSVPVFRTCTVKTTVGGWLCRYFCIKVLSGFLIGLLLWCFLSVLTNPQLSVAVLVPVLTGEYLLYRFLPVQSAFNVLKYLNIFSCVHCSDIYTEYLNINFFGLPLGNRTLYLILLPIGLGLCGWLSVSMQKNRYPEGHRDLLGRAAEKLNLCFDFFRTRLSSFGWEVYKWGILELGIVALILSVLVSMRLQNGLLTPVPESERLYRLYLSDCEGIADERMDDYLENAREKAAESTDSVSLLNALDRLEETLAEVRLRAAEQGYEPYMVDYRNIDAFYGETSVNRQRLNALAAILFTVLLTASLNAYENQAGVRKLLTSLPGGRKNLLLRKFILAAILSFFAFSLVYFRELYQAKSYLHKGILSAAVQNTEELSDFPWILSFRSCLILLYLFRYLMLYPVAVVMLLLGDRVKNIRLSMTLGLGILVLPALFVILGGEGAKWISPLVPVSAAELFTSLGAGKWWATLPFVVWGGIGVTAGWIQWKRE